MILQARYTPQEPEMPDETAAEGRVAAEPPLNKETSELENAQERAITTADLPVLVVDRPRQRGWQR